MDIKLMPEKYKRGEELVPESKLAPASLSERMVTKANLWLGLSLSLLIIVILITFGLWGYQNSLIREKANLEERITESESQRDLDLEANFVELKKGIENFKNVSKTHIYPSYLFEMIEELTLPQVRFVEFGADLSKAKVTLTAEAVNYNILAKQIVVLEQDSRIKKVELSEVSLGDTGGVGSELEIEFNPDFLRPAP